MVETPAQVKRSWNFRKADWAGFPIHLDILCECEAPTKEFEVLFRNFTNNVNTTTKLFISRERDLLNEQLKTNNMKETRKLLAEATTRVKDKVAMNKQLKWSQLCKTFDPRKDAKFWRITKLLNSFFTSIGAQGAKHTKCRSGIFEH
ncbi:hypothetical protein TNIN_347261 [Trichonephila inaurata madagascariensis]|uniref:Uncharacterized protein n=1 Tax=Trichonephila inaurata madagascariensis TaxID=2747483 RepID=A0A8X6IS41_9ARAC|nr:hypothetical protein TNIN_347261 [Trichonephila inaurata madagascariensis]